MKEKIHAYLNKDVLIRILIHKKIKRLTVRTGLPVNKTR